LREGEEAMTYENYIKAKIVDLAVEDAYHHGGIDGMLAVAQVLANRVKAGWGEWNVVLRTAKNFRGTTPEPVEIDPRDIGFRRILSAIDDIYNGVADDSNVNVTDDRGEIAALYYAELNRIDRQWFIDNVTTQLDRHPRIATVGPLSFFG
jgi:hypothetical protein